MIAEITPTETNHLEWPTINIALYDLTRARIDSALGHHAEARGRATALREYFDQRGASSLVLETDFVLFEIDFRDTGRLDEDQAQAMIAAARTQGQEMIARRVTALGQS